MPISLPYVLLDSPAAVSSRLDDSASTWREIAGDWERLAVERRTELELKEAALNLALQALSNATTILDLLRNDAQAVMASRDPLMKAALANVVIGRLLAPPTFKCRVHMCANQVDERDVPCRACREEAYGETGGDL